MKQVVIFNYWLESGKGNSVSVPEASNFIEKGTLAEVFSCELFETSSGGCFCEKHLGEINDLKNQGQEILLENDEVIFEEVEELGNKYRDFVARYDIPIDEIESNLRSRNRKTECDRVRRKKNGVDDDEEAAVNEEDKRRYGRENRF